MALTQSLFAIALGAAVGANLRWLLSLALNSYLPALPLGTLAANLLGAFLIGVAIAAFAALPDVPTFWRLLIVTGFLGALTTFSTFSAEIFTDVIDGKLLLAFVGMAAHVLGSLVMTGLGFATFVGVRHLTGATG